MVIKQLAGAGGTGPNGSNADVAGAPRAVCGARWTAFGSVTRPSRTRRGVTPRLIAMRGVTPKQSPVRRRMRGALFRGGRGAAPPKRGAPHPAPGDCFGVTPLSGSLLGPLLGSLPGSLWGSLRSGKWSRNAGLIQGWAPTSDPASGPERDPKSGPERDHFGGRFRDHSGRVSCRKAYVR